MALPKDRKQLQAEWEARLAKEGLAPLTTYGYAEKQQRRLKAKIQKTTAGQKRAVERYYARAEKFARRLEMAHGVWSLHCSGLGRREIAYRLQLREKVVRLVLEKCSALAGL